MSEQTLDALVQAAKAFKNDTSQLPALRDALVAHDADEGTESTPEPAPPTTLAEGQTAPSQETSTATEGTAQ